MNYTSQTELRDMFASTLGCQYDSIKVDKVVELQNILCDKHQQFVSQLKSGVLDNEVYVDSVNSLFSDTFAQIEKLLGGQDFEKLFGVPRESVSGIIDTEIFLQSRNEGV